MLYGHRRFAQPFQSDVEKAYKFGKVLGTGNFAEVRLATHRETNKK